VHELLDTISGVARIWYEEGHETKEKVILRATHKKYYEIHAQNSDKVIDHILFY